MNRRNLLLSFGLVAGLSSVQVEATEVNQGLPTDAVYYITTSVQVYAVEGDFSTAKTYRGIGAAYGSGQQTKIDLYVPVRGQWQRITSLYPQEELSGEEGQRRYEGGRWVGLIAGYNRMNVVKTILTKEEVARGGIKF